MALYDGDMTDEELWEIAQFPASRPKDLIEAQNLSLCLTAVSDHLEEVSLELVPVSLELVTE